MGLRDQADKLRLWGPTPGCQVETSFVKKVTLGMGKGVGSREEVVLGGEEEGLRLEWGLSCANPKSLLQELQQDLASDCLLFTQVCPGFLPRALYGSSGPILPPPLLHLLLRKDELNPGMDPITSDYMRLGLLSFFSPSLARPGSISFSKMPCSRGDKLRFRECQGLA